MSHNRSSLFPISPLRVPSITEMTEGAYGRQRRLEREMREMWKSPIQRMLDTASLRTKGSVSEASTGPSSIVGEPAFGHAAARRLGLGKRWWEETIRASAPDKPKPGCYVPSKTAREAHDIVRTRDADAALALLYRLLRERLL